MYAVFAVAALFAGAVLNTIGPRWTMLVGTTGYPVYIGSLWYFDVQGHLWFPIFGGAYLGLAAACLWTTAAFVTGCYAEEKDRGVR